MDRSVTPSERQDILVANAERYARGEISLSEYCHTRDDYQVNYREMGKSIGAFKGFRDRAPALAPTASAADGKERRA